MSLRVSRSLPVLVVLSVLAGAGSARAGDITAFVAKASPTDTWATGYGATISTSWLNVLNLEGEAAKVPGAALDTNMISFTGSALIAPPVGSFTPYGGLGLGVFRQSLGSRHDTGTLKALVIGVKLKLGGMIVVKGEYRRYDLSGEPLLPLEHRLSAGAGITF